ncbi:chloride channel protein [Bifidobacterium cuniculi]|uniref:Voltage gated chloride channel family protein n=1 Tax=Bifidobacterium cuniculi TaxID=1688 RepID=A0A087B559_9BIFI|nr:chloride channel protein [Bifidobacterium cuniculi]KFI66159.1 voltage gated chloride channel family protein [Bifidobacterium cuniculi]
MSVPSPHLSDTSVPGDGQGTLKRIDIRQVLRHMLFAVVCGLACGFASVLLCLCIEAARHLFEHATWLLWFLPVLGAIQLLMYRWWKLPLNLTTDAVIERMRAGKPISALLAPGILFATGMTIMGGGSVGKEAGALQIGASLGTTISKPFHLRDIWHADARDDTGLNRYIASTGMAATFSALFFAPLGSCMLVLELMRFVQLRYVVSMLLACFVAYGVSSAFRIGDIIVTVPVPQFDWHMVGTCVIIGIAAALGGSVFALAIRLLQSLTMRIRHNYYVWVVVGGLLYAVLVTACGWWRYTGSGGALLNEILRTPDISWGFAIKMLLTVICLGLWFKGGEIMPSFCIGGLLGSASFVMTGADPLFGAAVGAICFLAAFNRCPVSAFLLGCEIFGWGMAPFLGLAVAVSFLFGYPVGIYGSDIDVLARSGWAQLVDKVRAGTQANEDDKDAGLMDFVVAAGHAAETVAESVEQAADDEAIAWQREHPRRRRRHHGSGQGRGHGHTSGKNAGQSARSA